MGKGDYICECEIGKSVSKHHTNCPYMDKTFGQEHINKLDNMKDKINFKKYIELSEQLEIKIGTIRSVERVPKSDKMLKLVVSFSEDYDNTLTVVTNIGNRIVDIDKLIDVTLPFITNLEPVKIMGIISEAMIMIPEKANGDLEVDSASNGSKLM